MNEVAKIGDNNPPNEFEITTGAIDDLYEEAKHWLDGEDATSEKDAEGLATLLNMLRSAQKSAETARTEEKAPSLQEGRDIMEKYRPFVDKAQNAINGCKKSLAPWLVQKEAEKQAELAAARKAEEDARKEAAEAFKDSAVNDLQAREDAEELQKLAKDAEIKRRMIDNKSAGASNKAGKAVSLRTYYIPELTNPIAAIKHYWPNDDINAILLKLAHADIRNGQQEIPGFEIKIEKRAV